MGARVGVVSDRGRMQAHYFVLTIRRLFFSTVRRTLLVLLIIVLVPGIAIEVSHYRALSEEYRDHELASALEIAHAVATSFDSYIHRLLSTELAFGTALASPLAPEQANRLLATGAAGDPVVRVYSWIGPDGKVIASSDPRSVGQDFSVRPYFRQIVEGRDWVVSDLLEGQSGDKTGFAVARGIRDDAGVLKGVLGAMVDAGQLGSVTSIERAGRASVGLIDRQGRLAYRVPELDLPWDQRSVLLSQPFIQPALDGEIVSGVFATIPDGETRVAGYVPLGLTGWVAGAGRPEQEVMEPLAGEFLRESALKLLASLAAVVTAMAVGRIIIVPIRRFREHALALGRGEPGVPVDVWGPGELKDLADSFKRMAAEIQARENKLRQYQLLNKNARDIILFMRPDGRIVEANEAACGAYGYDEAELLSMRIGDLSAPGTSYAMDARSQDDQDSILFETVHRHKDGSTFPVEVASQGAAIGDERLLLAIIRDATTRKGAEDARMAQFQHLSAMFDSMNAIVYVAEMDTHKLVFLNRYGAELFGHDSLGRPCYEVLQVGQAQECPFCTNNRLLIDGVPQPPYVWEFQNTVTGKWFMCIDRAITWDDGRLVRMEVAVDITQRRLADEFREQYVFSVSHDLRNPLGAIQGLAQLLLRRLEKGERTDTEVRAAERILTSAERMNSIIQDLLDSVRLEAGLVKLEKQPVNLASSVADLLERCTHLTGDRLVRTEIPAGLLVSADPGRMERVLMNLLTNAIKYSFPASEVIIRASNRRSEAIVAITDRGTGIDPDDLPRVFERFYRSRAARGVEGIGLGLYITRMLIEAHGGRVWAESEPGKGSTFYFTLPLA